MLRFTDPTGRLTSAKYLLFKFHLRQLLIRKDRLKHLKTLMAIQTPGF